MDASGTSPQSSADQTPNFELTPTKYSKSNQTLYPPLQPKLVQQAGHENIEVVMTHPRKNQQKTVEFVVFISVDPDLTSIQLALAAAP